MATKTYEFLGSLETGPGNYGIAIGKCAVTDDETYIQANKLTLTFPFFSKVDHVIDMFATCEAGTSNPLQLVSIATNVVTFAVMESGGAAAIFPEKTNAEAYGQSYDFYVIAAGL